MEIFYRLLTDGINPFFLGLLLGAAGPSMEKAAWKFRGQCFVSVALAVLLAEAGKKYTIWPTHPGFPSGHTTFAASCAACLILRDQRWAFLAAPLALVMAWALVCAHFHETPDVMGALFLGPLVAALVFRVSR